MSFNSINRNGTPAKRIKLDDNKNIQHETFSDFDNTFEHDFSVLNYNEPKKCLDLTNWKRCIVEQVERDESNFDIVLLVRDLSSTTDNKRFGKCRLQGPWSHTNVAKNDIVGLEGKWDNNMNCYKVDGSSGFCVTNPDFLLSTTTVLGSLFCLRKSLLQERFRGIDANSKVMVIGSLVHQLFQNALTKNLKTLRTVEQAAKQLLNSNEIMHILYGSMMNQEETAQEVNKFVPQIVSFIEQYVEGKTHIKRDANVFQGVITEIKDIEENLWVPKLGLKGKIDVSVCVEQRKKGQVGTKTILPLELKTGRVLFSAEHKGQIMLYQSMLTALGNETSSGLLLYLRECNLREIQCEQNSQRDLMILRNELSHYLSQSKSPCSEKTSSLLPSDKFVQPFPLSDPISHHRACNSCAYSTLCCSFAHTDPDLELPKGHPLFEVMNNTISHLKSNDFEYFLHWCALLTLEDQEGKKSNYLRALWTESPEQRQDSGRAIVGLKLDSGVSYVGDRYQHTWTLDDPKDDIDLSISSFSIGEYVIISTRKRIAIATGLIQTLTTHSISISVERNLHKNYGNQEFVIDKHESNVTNVFNYTNLGELLASTDRANRLRDVIIHGKKPIFFEKLPATVGREGLPILKSLNRQQQLAAIRALTTDSYLLIKGLPGTGKTQTLVAIVRLLHMIGKSVIITSYTHSAVDNILLRLIEYKLPIMRLGAAARVNPKLHEYQESELLKNCHTEADLAREYAAYSIVGVTCLGSSHSIFLHRKFDYCIIDEATQVMQPTALRPLFYADKFILVGDPDQLPPLIRSPEARRRGADISLFQYLDSFKATIVLSLQYRMNKTITKLANDITYCQSLQCATTDLEMSTIKFKLPSEMSSIKWLQRALHQNIDQAVCVLNTLDCSSKSIEFMNNKCSKTYMALEKNFAEPVNDLTDDLPVKQKPMQTRHIKYTNYCEAAVIFKILKCLLLGGYSAERIGVIAPYRAQVELLRKLSKQHQTYYEKKSSNLMFSLVEVNTVDQYQGRDKDIIIYSCTRTGPLEVQDHERTRDAEILEDKRRLTVAITRSKFKLIIVGDISYLEKYTPFQKLFESIRSISTHKLENGRLDFYWQSLLKELSQVMSVDN